MRRFFFTILSMAAIGAAHAAEAPKASGSLSIDAPGAGILTTKENTNTVKDCMNILAGLEEIDALHDVVVNQGKPTEQVIKVPYEFGNATFRKALSTNIRILRVIRDDQQQASQKELLVISSGKGEIRDSNKQPGDAWDKEHAEYLRQTIMYDKRMKELTGATCPIDRLTKLKASELKLDKNEIRSTATALADKVIDWDH